jgi:hypothetical protein
MFTGREFSKESESYYWRTIRKNDIGDSEAGRLLFNRGFYLGAQFAMRTSSELSPHIARFLEFVMWLTEKEDDRDSET